MENPKVTMHVFDDETLITVGNQTYLASQLA